MLEFHSSPNPTIGVEIELQLIDDNTFDLKNISPKILTDVDKKFLNRIKYELFESMIEINTDICNTVDEVNNDIKQTLNHLEEILKSYNASINCSSLHPFAKGKNLNISQLRKLVISIKKILKKAIIFGGSSIKNYVSSDGTLGNFQSRFLVYNQEGKKISKFVVKKAKHHGRATYYCPELQKNRKKN